MVFVSAGYAAWDWARRVRRAVLLSWVSLVRTTAGIGCS